MKIIHTMIRVKDLEASLEFYTQKLGMKVLEKHEFEEARFTLVYVGYTSIDQGACLELTYNWDPKEYELGNAYGHLAIGVEDIYGLIEDVRKKGVEVTREPGPMKGSPFVIAFIKDPDGYLIEFVEQKGG